MRAHKIGLVAYATSTALLPIGLSPATASTRATLMKTCQAMTNDNLHGKSDAILQSDSSGREAYRIHSAESKAEYTQSRISFKEELGTGNQVGFNSEPLPNGQLYYPELDGSYGCTPTFCAKQPDNITIIPLDF